MKFRKAGLVPVAALLTLGGLVGCTDQTPVDSASAEGYEANYVRDALAAAGLPATNFVETDDHVIVDGDMVVSKADLLSGAMQKTTHYSGYGPMSYWYAQNLKVKIHSSMSAWSTEIADAISSWEAAEGALDITIVATGEHVTIYADTVSSLPTGYKKLDSNVCGVGDLAYGGPGPKVSINVDAAGLSTYERRRFVLQHELGHTFGYTHTDNPSGWQIFLWGTPASDANSLMNSGTCGSTYDISAYDNAAVQTMFGVSGEVSAGNIYDFDYFRAPYHFAIPTGLSASSLRGLAISKSTGYVYGWTSDGKVSAGWSSDLDLFVSRTNFSVASGKSVSQLVDVGIAASSGYCYAWYSDGTVSSGDHTDLDRWSSPQSYSLASGKSPSDIVGVCISASNKCCAFYSDGTGSLGNHVDLDYYGTFSYSVASGKSISDIQAIGMNYGSKSFVYYNN